MDNTQETTTDFRMMVDTLLRAAFETGAEADLVIQLRADNAMASEIVVRGRAGLLGYAAVSRMVGPKGWLCLAPVAVMPAAQRLGHGVTLLKLVNKWAAEQDAVIVVLGFPEFYQKHGFSQARAAKLTSRYPSDFTLLAGPGADVPEETLIYPKAFDDLR